MRTNAGASVMSALYKWACTTCGSDKVCLEAEAQWNTATQSFEYNLRDAWDNDFCDDCYATVRTEQKDLTDLKDIALVAAHTPIFKSVRSNAEQTA